MPLMLMAMAMALNTTSLHAASIMDVSGWISRTSNEQCTLSWSTSAKSPIFTVSFAQGTYRLSIDRVADPGSEFVNLHLSLDGIGFAQNIAAVSKEKTSAFEANFNDFLAHKILTAMADGTGGQGELKFDGELIAAWDGNQAKDAADEIQKCYYAYIADLEETTGQEAGQELADSTNLRDDFEQGSKSDIEFIGQFVTRTMAMEPDARARWVDVADGYWYWNVASKCSELNLVVDQDTVFEMKSAIHDVMLKNKITNAESDYLWKIAAKSLKRNPAEITPSSCMTFYNEFRSKMSKYLVSETNPTDNPFGKK